jgi:cell division protein FtsQ
VLESSLLVVERVEVVGAQRQDVEQVRSAVAGVVGRQLARVDTGDVERDVAALPVVRTAEAVRVWPSTLEVRLVERVPVAAVPDVSGYVLVDRTGAPVVARAEPPADLPVVDVNLRIAAPGTLPAVLQVMDDLPSDLRAEVERVGATSPDSVGMQLRAGQSVVWGGPDDAALKARVLDVLLTQEAEVYDVSSPRTPVTR